MVIKNRIQPPNRRDDSSRGIESPANPLEGRFSRSGTSDHGLECLVFDPEKFALGEEGRCAAPPDATLSSGSKADHEQAAEIPRRRVCLRAFLIQTLGGLIQTLGALKIGLPVRRLGIWTTATIVLSIAVAGVTLYIACSDGYRVETKLLLFDRDHNANNSAGRSLEEEVAILKSPQILHLLAREIYDREPEILAQGGHLRTVSSASTKELSGFSSPEDLEKWLAKRTYLTSNVSEGMALVALRLRGDDPDLLSSVLDAYICRYVDYRRTVEAESRKQVRQTRRRESNPADTNSTEAISAQVQKIDFQEQGSKLALQLIDSGRGVFSGFVPDQSLTGVPSLTHFQDKIIQLEIKKKALATQYMPGSREIVVVDLEIQGVRSAMRECLVEHLQFLQKEREQLIARRDGPDHYVSPLAGHDQVLDKARCGPQPTGGDSWLVPRDGLYVLREKPVIAQRPLLARTGHLANRLIAYLAPPPSATVVSEFKQKPSSSMPPGLSADGRAYNSGGLFQGSPAQQSFQPVQTTPPVWQRAATSSSDATQRHIGPTNSRPRQ
jgi:hypothetical protein